MGIKDFAKRVERQVLSCHKFLNTLVILLLSAIDYLQLNCESSYIDEWKHETTKTILIYGIKERVNCAWKKQKANSKIKIFNKWIVQQTKFSKSK